MSLYSLIFKTVFARMDPEKAHNIAFNAIKVLNKVPWLCSWYTKPHKSLQVETMGKTFPSPFGLAAGFDKNAEAITGLEALGFGHIEIGTVTAHAQDGNPTPRLFRLIQDLAVINRMGFNNKGSQAAVGPLKKALKKPGTALVGVNIGKSKITPLDKAKEDYVISAQRLAQYADYMVVNVSSPNTPGLRGLQEIQLLEPILRSVMEAIGQKPLLVKIAPDMDDEQILEVVDLSKNVGLAGIIATNTTISRAGLTTDPERVAEIGAGGLSGKPLSNRSLEVLKLIKQNVPEDFCIISVGGVTSGKDVIERIKAGANLVQGYTAFIYQGPFWAKKINRELARAL